MIKLNKENRKLLKKYISENLNHFTYRNNRYYLLKL